jgi:transcriptional regulator of aromatic amino acid metabolism
MELRVHINQHILNWLASMGYPVSGMPIDAIEKIFVREARQWEVSPERLDELVREGERVRPPREHVRHLTALPSWRPIARTEEFTR